MTRLVITPDPSSGGTVRMLGKREKWVDTVLFCGHDDLTFGPLIPTANPEQLFRKRYKHWRRNAWSSALFSPSKNRAAPGLVDPRRKQSLPALMDEASEITLWTSGVPREQLFLLALSMYLSAADLSERRVSVLQYKCDGQRQSLGYNSVDDLAIRPEPVTLTPSLLLELQRLWSVVTHCTPEPLFELASRGIDIPELPYLIRTFEALVSLYPDAETGLGAMERRLLEACPTDWTKAQRVSGNAMMGDGTEWAIGDVILSWRLAQLAASDLAEPAIELRGPRKTLRKAEARITSFGQDCLAGRRNLVTSHGIDTWIGGVHLSSATGDVWYRNSDGGLIKAA